MKLMIDIPKNYYEVLKTLPDDQLGIELAIKYGTPLDDVKAEISRKANSGQWSEAVVYGMAKAIAILDNIGKAESEV